MLSCRGILEFHTINAWYDDRIMDEHFYAVSVFWILGVGGVSAALIKFLYKPSDRFTTGKHRTVQHASGTGELRILACVHEPENVPPLLALLSVSFATPKGGHRHFRSPVGLYVLHLIPLVGRTSGVLAPYGDKKRRHCSSATDAIVNAFLSLQWNLPHISFFPFVGTSPYISMHEDVCELAADKGTALIVLPFHKHISAGGITCSNPSVQFMNINVFHYAPCSVAILVERRRADEAGGAAARAVTHRTTVLFLGGADDREALAIGTRLSQNPVVQLTIMRILPPAEMWESSADEREDEEAVEEFRETVDGNRVIYREAVAGDGSATVDILKEICANCTFLIVGRREGKESAAMTGLEEWREYPELGVIGDMMALAEFGATVSTMVVQQQAFRDKVLVNEGKNISPRWPGHGGARVHDCPR